MKNKRFWPEQIEEARTLAVQEKKFLTREYDAVLDPRLPVSCSPCLLHELFSLLLGREPVVVNIPSARAGR